MKASELRIGNWYQNKSSNDGLKYQQVTGFEDMHYIAIYCDPIPLTEEWLLKFGFETDHICWFKDGITIGDYKDGFFYIPAGISFAKRENPIESVHQLQNLFFALTGEELTITA